jgi:hypothetical protein
MSDNPYTPPTAPVLDPSPKAPRAVQVAVVLLSAAAFAAVGREAFWSGDVVVGSVMLLLLALLGLLIYKIWVGRNWARILFLAIVVFGSLDTIPQMMRDASSEPVTAATSLLILAAQVAALALLFIGTGRAWFRKSQSVANAVV